MNSITLTGRITKTPETKQKQNGNGLYCYFTLAVDDGKDANGEKLTSFIDCIAYDKQASFLGNYIKKGYLIGVNGSLHVSTTQDEQGNYNKRATVRAWSVENLQPREQPTQQAQTTQPAQPIQQAQPAPTAPAVAIETPTANDDDNNALPFEI